MPSDSLPLFELAGPFSSLRFGCHLPEDGGEWLDEERAARLVVSKWVCGDAQREPGVAVVVRPLVVSAKEAKGRREMTLDEVLMDLDLMAEDVLDNAVRSPEEAAKQAARMLRESRELIQQMGEHIERLEGDK